MEHKDPLTGELFIPQRNNQIFANRSNQIRYNNLRAGKKRKSKSTVDKILDKNRTILITVLNGEPEAVRSKDFLLGAGFHFGCLTHNDKVEEVVYHCIYDYCYTRLKNNQYNILKWIKS